MIKNRSPFIDIIRFLGIGLMVIFHFTYDLHLFNLGLISRLNLYYWNWFPKFIVFLFMLSMGMSLGMNTSSKVYPKSFYISQLKLLASALIISISTYYLYPSRWVYFGTLHCIFLCRFFIAPLRKRPYLSLLLFVLINIPLFLGFNYPWPKMSHQSMDYIPLLPWLSYGLLGVFLSSTGIIKLGSKIGTPRFVSFLSKRSLLIYMIHQPILYGLASIIYFFKSKFM